MPRRFLPGRLGFAPQIMGLCHRMLQYKDGTIVRCGDRIRFSGESAVVEDVIEGDAAAHWALPRSGFLIAGEQYGRMH